MLCIFSFIAFGISVAVLGTNSHSGVQFGELESIITNIDEEFSRIEVYSTAANVRLYPTSEDRTVVHCTSEKARESVAAYVDGDTLKVDCCIKGNNFFDIKNFFELFNNDNNTVEIYVPDKTYDIIKAQVNAGNTDIIDVPATIAELTLNAGNLNFAQPEGFRSEDLTVNINAGNCKVYRANTHSYDIDMAAGNIKVYGLEGEGKLHLSAGNGTVNYADLNGDIEIDVSAGNLDVNLPEDASAVIECDKSAGDIDIDHGDIDEDMDDGDKITLGSGEYDIKAHVSAGDIKISDKVKEHEAPASPDVLPTVDMGASTTNIVQSMTEPIVVEPIVVDPIGNATEKLDSVTIALDEAGDEISAALDKAGDEIENAIDNIDIW